MPTSVLPAADAASPASSIGFQHHQHHQQQSRGIRAFSSLPLKATSLRASNQETESTSQQQQQWQQHLILVGGGHAHAQVIKALNAQARPSHLKVTLIDGQRAASYSGMVPACVAGFFTQPETKLHLDALAEWAGMDFVNDRVKDIDLDNKLVYLENTGSSEVGPGKPLPFDAISLDIGSASRNLESVPGASTYTIPTRPIDKLVERVRRAEEEWKQEGASEPPRLVVVGGGAAGIELSLSMTSRWQKMLSPDTTCTLLDAGDLLLPQESEAAREKLKDVMSEKSICVQHRCEVKEITPDHVVLSTGQEIPYTHCIWATGAGAHPLAKRLQHERGLGTTEHGWITVGPTFQSTTHPFVFAAGDCCTMKGLPSGRTPPKAGVYAVRAGPILIQNLPKYLDSLQHDEPDGSNVLTEYEPQDDFLKLFSCGDGKALGLRFGLVFYGKWVFDLKNRIDLNFMQLFDPEKLPDRSRISRGNYDTSQYDAQDDIADLPLLSPREAAKLLQRTDDDVDYRVAWKILRNMAQDADYLQTVLEHVETAPLVAT